MPNLRNLFLWLLLAVLAPAIQAATTVETYTFTGNREIPDGNASGMSDVRTVPSTIGTITGVKVGLKITGEYNGDLYGYLRHGSGFTVLLNRPGRTSVDTAGYPDSGLNITLENGAVNGDIHNYRNLTIPPPGSPLVGIFQPDGRDVDPAGVTNGSPRTTDLTSFNNLSASGEWSLYLADLESGGTNMLTEWSLEITGSASALITWANPADIVYGTPLDDIQLNATATYLGTSVPGTFVYTPAAGTVLNAGLGQVLSVTFTPSDLVAFQPVTTTALINVTPALLTITANDQTKVYGADLPALTASYEGFVNGDTSADLDPQVSLVMTATAASAAGNYPITASGAANPNYAISYVEGTLIVTPAGLTITANNATTVYGAALPTFTASYSGLVNGDGPGDINTPVILSTTATAGSPVGTYSIIASGAADPNYTIGFVSGILTVTPAALTITADDKTKVYGAGLPEFTASYSGFVNGDTAASLDTAVALNTAATSASPVGTYAITASTAEDLNYTISFVNGTLTVTPGALTITADDKTKVFGEALPVFTATYTGFVNGDTVLSLDTPVVLETEATSTSAAGTYPITARGATDANYTISFVSGTLTIGQSLTTGVLISSLNPAPIGDSVTFTMTVTATSPGAGIPNGTVDFYQDEDFFGSGTLVDGVATYAISSLSRGSHLITAIYLGEDANFVGVTSTLTQVINTPPIAGPDTIERYPTQGVKVLIATLLENDSEVGFILSPANFTVSPTSANGGAVTIVGAWVFYEPLPGFLTADSFTYTIADNLGGSAIGTVTVAILVDNDPAQNLAIVASGADTFDLVGNGIPGRTYRLQSTPSLSSPTWVIVPGGNLTANDVGFFIYPDIPNATTVFYRTVYP